MKRVAVFGAGVTGLAAAWMLRQMGAEVEVYDPAGEPGGVVRTRREGGYLLELGPNTVLEKGGALSEWMDGLGLRKEVIYPGPEARRRYIWHGGRLEAVPMSPWGAVRTRLLSWRGKLRVLSEPWREAGTAGDESVAAFFSRRLGEEVVEGLVDPFVSGIYAGDVVRLSARFCFPKLWGWEREAGSLVRGMLGARKSGGSRARMRLISFAGGLSRLVNRAAETLGENLHLGEVPAVTKTGAGWEVAGYGRFDGVVAAMPWRALGEWLVGCGLSDAGREWPRVEHAGVRVWHFGVRREVVGHSLDGFGVLAPSAAAEPILGVLFSSTLFPDRAPAGHVLLTVFQGGVRQPQWCGRGEEEAAGRVAWEAVSRWLGIRGEPVMKVCTLWPAAIPQYEVGYQRVLDEIAEMECEHKGLILAGSYRGGVAVGDCVAGGFAAADRVLG